MTCQSMTSQHHKIAKINHQPLPYIDKGTGPVLLFCHGLLMDKSMWQQQIELLSRDYRCIAIDLWGHGDSHSIPDSTTQLPDIAKQYLQLLELLSIEQCTVIGLGTGGAIATEMVLQAPKMIAGLVLINAFVGFEPEVNCAKYQIWMDSAKKSENLSALINDIAPLFAPKNQQTTETIATAKLHFEQYSSISQTHKNALLAMCRMGIYKRDSLENVEQLTLPCLVMIGVQSQLRTVLESYLMHDAIDGSELVHLVNAGQLAPLEQPVDVNQHLQLFLTKMHKS